MLNSKFIILTEYDKIKPYITQIQKLSDSNKNALGFFRNAAFYDVAVRGRLWIVINKESNELIAYLLFGGRYPVLRIFQLFVKQAFRKESIGNILLKKLLGYGEESRYFSIVARVAADLPANLFWEHAGFPIIRQEPGGRSRGRIINVRIKRIITPPLLKILSCEDAGPCSGLKSLKIGPRPLITSQTYVLDLNVFFDVVKSRIHQESAAQLIASGLNQEIRVFVTPEFTQELNRHSALDKRDPILKFARHLPTLPNLAEIEIEQLITELKYIVFPDNSVHRVLRVQSQSDLRHLAYCIHHRVSGFITREKAILAANSQLQDAYQLEILSPIDVIQPSEYRKSESNYLNVNYGHENVLISSSNENQRIEVEQFLISHGIKKQDLPTIWHPGSSNAPRRRITARVDNELIAVASWDHPGTLKNERILYLYVDEKSSQAEKVIDHIIEVNMHETRSFKPNIIILYSGLEQIKTRTTAIHRGFISTRSNDAWENNPSLSKFTFRGIISNENWDIFSKGFSDLLDLYLPERIPNIKEFMNSGISIRDSNGINIYNLSLFEFEVLVSPGIVCCPGREALIVPIQKKYAVGLFKNVNSQINLFPSHEALLNIEKAYFRSPRKESYFERGTLILFYLSGRGGGTKEILGCARVTYTEVLSVDMIKISLHRQGVLQRESLNGIADKKGRIHAFTFDNYIPLIKRVPFHELKSRKLISGSNLVTVEKISAKKLKMILNNGLELQGQQNV